MIVRAARILGLAVTVLCWYWAINGRWSGLRTMIMIWCTPLLQYPISILGRRFLDAGPTTARSEKADIFVHYAIMISLGVSIFPRSGSFSSIRLAESPFRNRLVMR